ncbi:MAG: DUF2339 domain-containing protein [Myxococcota bacterium]|nr:DUF2339 domain-containing protein [Myxococcota bacterium]
MDDAILAFLVCVLPLGMVGGLVVWLVRASRKGGSQQVLELEAELHRLRAQNQELVQRIQHLEVGLTRVYVHELPALSARLQGVEAAPRSLAEAETSATDVMPSGIESRVIAGSAGAVIAASTMGPSTMGPSTMGPSTMGPSTVGPGAGVEAVPGAIEGGAVSGAVEPPSVEPVESGEMESGAIESGVVGAALPLELASASAAGTSVDAVVASSASTMASASSAASATAAPSASSPVSAPPAGAPPNASAPTPPRPPSGGGPSSGGGLEQWIGVRGAAALGAIVLVIAGLYFFQYSIEHGLISPALRLALGVGVGLTCVAASELRLRHRHPTLAQWLTGAGIAILYVAFWAGRALYELYPSWAASVAMIATTGACITLASARRSVVVAALGLFGGFVTPLALSTGQDRPIALFGYLLVLDGAMLWLAYRRRWAWLALASLVGTALYQVGWILARLDEPRVLLGAGILGLFALVFAALPRRASVEGVEGEGAREDRLWAATRAGGVLVPLLLANHLSHRGDLAAHFAVTAPLLLALAAGSAWVGARHGTSTLPLIAAIACVGSLFGATLVDATQVWQLVALLLGLALVFHVATEFASPVVRAPDATGHAGGGAAYFAALTLVLGGLVLVSARGFEVSVGGPWPWALALVVLAALGLRQARFWPETGAVVGGLVGLGASLVVVLRPGISTPAVDGPRVVGLLGLALVLAALPNALVLFPRARSAHRRFADFGAFVGIVCVAFLLPGHPRLEALPPLAYFGGSTLACGIAALAVWRFRVSFAFVVVILAHAWATSLYVVRAPLPFDVLVWLGASLPALLGVAIALGPTTTSSGEPIFVDDRWRWRAAALGAPLAFPAARAVHLDVFGQDTVGLVAILLAAIAALVLYLAYRRGPRDADARRSALAWASAATSGLVTVAIPVQLENEWITIGWALEALALALVWRRLDHAGLKYFALGLVTLVGVRLVGNPYVLDYYPRGEWRILNWLSYTYLVPSLALVGTWNVLQTLERDRLRGWEKAVFGERAFVATFSAAAAIAVVFVWINLTIFDVFAEGPALTVPFDRLPARDLSLSVAWALYALALLGLGMRRRVLALRITSLVLVLVTSGKVFLYDLAYLRDLYRVASLVGLALSLIAISFVYQRFVFREKARAEAES